MSRMRAASSTRRLISSFGNFLRRKPERHVLVHGHVRVERVVLEHHRDVAILRRHVVDDIRSDQDLAARDVLEAGDHAQRRGLAAARRADQHHELLVLDVEIDAAHRLDATVVHLDDFADRNFGHGRAHPFVAPAVRPAM